VLAHPERGLSNTLLVHLQQELAGVELTLRDHGTFEAVWFCGYEANSAEDLTEVRARHPEAGLLVTGRAGDAPWEDQAAVAGADATRRWPMAMEALRDEIVRMVRSRRSAARAG